MDPFHTHWACLKFSVGYLIGMLQEHSDIECKISHVFSPTCLSQTDGFQRISSYSDGKEEEKEKTWCSFQRY